MSESQIYFVLGNSKDPCGQQDFINSLNNIFDKSIFDEYGLVWPKHLDATVTLSQEIVPEKINIFMEDFSTEFVEHLIDVKHNAPNTRYIVILTEFLTISDSGYVSFNAFSTGEEIWSMVTRLKNFQLVFGSASGNAFSLLTRGLNSKVKNCRRLTGQRLWGCLFLPIIRSILNFLLSIGPVFTWFRRCLGDVSRSNDRLTYERRLTNLIKIRDEVSLYLVTHPDLDKMYKKVSFSPILELPLVFSLNRFQRNTRRSNGMFFSGNLTKFRQTRLELIRQSLVGPYKQYQYIETILKLLFEYLAFQSFDKKQLQYVIDDGLSVYFSPVKMMELLGASRVNGDDDKVIETIADQIFEVLSDHYPPINIITGAYANQRVIDVLPRYEIYVPQAPNWSRSSPVRIFRSLYHGLSPICLGEFSDHQITSVATNAKDEQSLRVILDEDSNDNTLTGRAKLYHERVYKNTKHVAEALIHLDA